MATVASSTEFEQLVNETGTVLPDLANFSLAYEADIAELEYIDTLTATSLAANRIELRAENSFNGFFADFVITGSGISPISTLDQLEQAIMDGLAAGDLDRITATADGVEEVLRLDVTGTGYTLRSDVQVLTVDGNLPTTLGQVSGIANALNNVSNAFTAQQEEDAIAAVLSELSAFDVNSVTLSNGGQELARIAVSETEVAISAQGYSVTASGNFSDFFDSGVTSGAVPLPDLIVGSVVVTNPAGTEIASIRDIVDLADLSAAFAQLTPTDGMTVQGTDGNDTLFGTPGDDVINPGDNAGGATGFDYIETGFGNDTVDMGDVVNGYVILDYGFLNGSGNTIDVAVDGGANTGTVDKGAAGSDTLLDVANPLFAGWTTGGFSIRGTQGDDSFDVTPQGNQWMNLRGGDGADTFSINGSGLVRLDFRDATQGIDVNLAAGAIADDGFGNAETIGGTSAVWEVQSSAFDDTFTGSNADESYRGFGGDNTLEGGGGFDRLRYDRNTITSVDIDAASGVASGTLDDGGTFTDTISGFERLRGSDGDDLIIADNRGNTLEGRGGDDTLVGGLGNDSFNGGPGANTFKHKGGFDWFGASFTPGVDSLIIDIPGLTQADVDAAMANPILFNGNYFVTFGDAQNITFEGLSQAQISLIQPTLDISPGQTEPVLIEGSDGDDQLIGTPRDDLIITRDATVSGDFVRGSTGDDTIDMSGMNQSASFITVSYQDLGSAITVDIDGAANTATVSKGALGLDTLLNIENPLIAGFMRGGLGIVGTRQDDTFNLAPGMGQWMQARGGEGVDSYEIGDTGFVRLGFAFTGAMQGAEIDLGLSSGQIINDGFGNTETITGPGTVWEIRGTENGDLITGSDADESFISQQGNDTIDGGGGFDRLRYDRFGVEGITADLAAGQVNGTWNGNAFTDTISNIAHLRGSDGVDVIAGDANDNLLAGRDAVDTFVHVGGSDTILDFDPGTETLEVRIAGLDQTQVDNAVNNAAEVPGGAFADASFLTLAGGVLVDFGGGNSVMFDGVTAADLASADLRYVDPGVALPPPPPRGPAAWTLGDPHLLTLDGLGYDFHAVGEYVLLRGQAGEAVGGFEVQSRMTPATDDQGAELDNVSVNAAIAMRAANGDAVMIDSDDAAPLSVGGVPQQLADGGTLDVGNDRIFRDGDTYTMVFSGADGTLNDGDTQVAVVVHDARVDLSVRISEALAGRVEGLLGDGDDDIGNDIARADGTALDRPLAFEDLYGGYRDDWRVDTEGDSLFTYDTGESLAGFYDPKKPGAVTTLDDFDAGDLATAQQAAEASGLTPGSVNYDNAVLDFLLTGDEGFIDSAASEDVAAPETASTTPTLDAGQGRATLSINVTDRAGDAVEGASVGFTADAATARSLGDDVGGGAYALSVGDGTSGRVGGTLGFTNAGEITAGDALEVLRIAVGLDPSWGPAQGLDFVAADLNGDARVTAGDALEVLRSAVGLDSEHAPEWVFIDPDQDVSAASANDVPELGGVDIATINGTQNVDMTAVLLGNMDSFA